MRVAICGIFGKITAEPDGEVDLLGEEEDARALVLERSKATRGGFDLVAFAVKAYPFDRAA